MIGRGCARRVRALASPTPTLVHLQPNPGCVPSLQAAIRCAAAGGVAAFAHHGFGFEWPPCSSTSGRNGDSRSIEILGPKVAKKLWQAGGTFAPPACLAELQSAGLEPHDDPVDAVFPLYIADLSVHRIQLSPVFVGLGNIIHPADFLGRIATEIPAVRTL